MPTQLEMHRSAMQAQAYPAVKQFISENPGYMIRLDQSGSQSVTNFVIFGMRESEDVIFKYFCEDERKAREVYALRHFAHTGVVPALIAESGSRLLVQSRIPGGWLPKPDQAGYAEIDSRRAGFTLGVATAKLTSTPLDEAQRMDFEMRFYEGLQLEHYFTDILDAATSVCASIPAYSSVLFRDSLVGIRENLPYILAQKRVLYHQDALNMHFTGSEFSGFFDLEMCRVGTLATQIGSLWSFFALYMNWQDFAEGLNEGLGYGIVEAEFRAAKAFADFLVWRYVTRYGRWRGDPVDTENHQRAEAAAEGYLRMLELNNSVTPT